MNLLKVTKSGVLSRHRHPNPVHGFVLKGRWHYLEHDWIAEEGSYVFEPPGETHTLVVPDDVDEMITYFQVNGVMYYVDPYGKHMGYEDVFTKIDMCRAHFEKVGMGADYVARFIRCSPIALKNRIPKFLVQFGVFKGSPEVFKLSIKLNLSRNFGINRYFSGPENKKGEKICKETKCKEKGAFFRFAGKAPQ